MILTLLLKRTGFCLLVLLYLVGCGAYDNSSNTIQVQINLVNGQKQKPSTSGVSRVTLAITGAGITPIFREASDFAGNTAIFNSATFEVAVPRVNGLIAKVEALDANGVVLFLGSAPLNLANAVPGQPVTLTIEVTRVPGNPPTVTLLVGLNSISEDVGTTTVTATLNRASDLPVTVTLSKSGTAIEGTDYTLGAIITIPAGSTSTSITLSPKPDTVDESDETVVIDLSCDANSNCTVATSSQQQTVTIINDDPPSTVTLTVGEDAINEEGGTTIVTATLTALSGRDVTVTLSTSGIAENDTDYTLSSTTIFIPAGQEKGSALLSSLDDSLDEINETVVIDLSCDANSNCTVATSQEQQTVTIIDDDLPPTVTLFAGRPALIESGESTHIVATLSTASGLPVTVTLIKEGTATDAIDYTLSDTIIAISAGDTIGLVTLIAINDRLAEPNETAIITLSCDDPDSNCTAGDTISQTVTITNGYFKNSVEGDQFGFAVAISGDGKTKAVGSPKNGNNAGLVSIFTLVNGIWSQTASFTGRDAEAGDQFGSSLALSDNGQKLVVGAPKTTDKKGAAYVFTTFDGINWFEEGLLTAFNPANDQFGFSVAINGDGTTVAVGAPGAFGVGSACVFIFDNVSWIQQVGLAASNIGFGDGFGTSVSLSKNGNALAVGAPFEDGSATSTSSAPNKLAANAGAGYVFIRSGIAWTQTSYVKASNAEAEDQFGSSVALNDTHLAVGAPFEDGNDDGEIDSGAVYVFTQSAQGILTQDAYVKASNIEAGDQFGFSVALNATTLVVGAPLEDSSAISVGGIQDDNTATDSGAVYVFTQSAQGILTQDAYVKASNTGADDQFGFSVSLDNAGLTLSVGAPFEDSGTTGVQPGTVTGDESASNSGAAYLY